MRTLQNQKNFCLPKETLKIFEFCTIINNGTLHGIFWQMEQNQHFVAISYEDKKKYMW
jgi:hypothetical protein